MTTITSTSESSITVTFGDKIDLDIHRKMMDFNARILANPFPGLLSVVPAYTSATVFFDPVLVKEYWPDQPSPARVLHVFLEEKILQPTISNRSTPNPQTLIEIPVRYNGSDLPEVAERLQLAENEVVRLHTETVYTVFMIGFLPGFPYLGPLPKALELPRRDTPRLRVPAGSVALAGQQTGIYPQASPGGWHLIGHTDFPLFNLAQNPPASLQPGMRVQFVPV